MSSDLLPVSFSDEALLAACVTPAVIAGVFVLIRLANGWKIAGRFHLDDCESPFPQTNLPVRGIDAALSSHQGWPFWLLFL